MAFAALRDIRSVTRVMATMAAVPSTAVMPIAGMEQNIADQEDRYPGHVEEGGRAHARHEGAHLIEIAQRLLHLHRLRASKRQRDQRMMDGILQA